MNVLIKYKSNGNGRLDLAANIVQDIEHFYNSPGPGRKISTITGDIWWVVPTNSPDADFVTLRR